MSSPGVALVTGATGFVGSRLVARLLDEGFVVRALSTGSSRDRVKAIEDKIQWFELDQEGLHASTRGVTHFYNFAVVYDKPAHTNDFITQANIELPLSILEQFKVQALPVVCVLGDTFYRKYSPDATKQVRYCISKQLLAQRVSAINWPAHVRIAFLLIEQVYGSGESLEKAYPRVARQMLENQPEMLMSLGQQQRDFIHVDDVVEAVMALTRASWHGTLEVECGSGQSTPVRTVFEHMHQLAASASKLKFGAIPADQDIAASRADIGLLKTFGWQPKVSLTEGLQDLLEDVQLRTRAFGDLS